LPNFPGPAASTAERMIAPGSGAEVLSLAPCPVIELPMCNECPDADNRVVDMLRELVADRLADFYVGLADEIVGGREPGEVGYGFT